MLSNNAVTVLEKRYLRKDEGGVVCETPEDLFRRVASTLAAIDAQYGASGAQVQATEERFYRLMSELDFLPNSPTLANAGTRTGQLSACFVLPVPDDLGGIFETCKQAALIHQTGGGTGFAFSRLRPKNDLVQSTKGVSSGPVSFMDVYNAATESIKQGGMRRGANMGILRVDHPDILEFIRHKEDLTKLTNFNISVAVTDAFMAALEKGEPYHLLNPRSGEAAGTLDAALVWREILQRAWNTGEPGVVFIDRMNRYCPVPWMGGYESTNPCGEQPLIPYESCNLGSINVERFVVTDASGARIDWDRLRTAVHVSTHLLDNVIDANHYPIPEIREVTHATRKIGLGLMGFARMLFRLGVGYGTEASYEVAETLFSFIDFESKVASIALAKTRGAFSGRNGHEAESNAFFERLFVERDRQPNRHPLANYASLIREVEAHGIRNSTTTTIAPTGTISIIADTSGGCEPVFALAFKRWQADTHMVDVDQVFLDHAKQHGYYSDALMEAIEANHGSLIGVEGFNLPREAFEVFVSAHDINPTEHVLIQAAFQKYNDSATSKTINFSEDATLEDVATAYTLAWQSQCKGITIYRNNSRQFQPLSVPKAKPETQVESIPVQAQVVHHKLMPRTRSEDLYGFTRVTMTGDGKLYTTVNYDEQGIREVVTNVGRSGGTLNSLSEAIGRLISLALQYNVPVDEIASQLIGIRGANPSGFGPKQTLSIPDAIGKVLKDSPRQLGSILSAQPVLQPAAFPQPLEVAASYPEKVAARYGVHAVEVYGESPECPECGHSLEFGEGCAVCRGCGYSRCS